MVLGKFSEHAGLMSSSETENSEYELHIPTLVPNAMSCPEFVQLRLCLTQGLFKDL